MWTVETTEILCHVTFGKLTSSVNQPCNVTKGLSKSFPCKIKAWTKTLDDCVRWGQTAACRTGCVTRYDRELKYWTGLKTCCWISTTAQVHTQKKKSVTSDTIRNRWISPSFYSPLCRVRGKKTLKDRIWQRSAWIDTIRAAVPNLFVL